MQFVLLYRRVGHMVSACVREWLEILLYVISRNNYVKEYTICVHGKQGHSHTFVQYLCCTFVFFSLPTFVRNGFAFSYTNSTVRQVRKPEDIETWIPTCTMLPKAKIIVRICNIINSIIGVDYKAFCSFHTELIISQYFSSAEDIVITH